jgi:hypothetical protein
MHALGGRRTAVCAAALALGLMLAGCGGNRPEVERGAARLVAFGGPASWRPVVPDPAVGFRSATVAGHPVVYGMTGDRVSSVSVFYAVTVERSAASPPCAQLAVWLGRVQSEYQVAGPPADRVAASCVSAQSAPAADDAFSTGSGRTADGRYSYRASVGAPPFDAPPGSRQMIAELTFDEPRP